MLTTRDSVSHEQLQQNVFIGDYHSMFSKLNSPVSIVIQEIRARNENQAELTLQSDSLALFVVLTTRENGRFLDNAFTLFPSQPKVSFSW